MQIGLLLLPPPASPSTCSSDYFIYRGVNIVVVVVGGSEGGVRVCLTAMDVNMKTKHRCVCEFLIAI